MQLKAKHIAIFAVLSAAIYTACRKDVLPDDPLPDPCVGVKPVTAEFKILETRSSIGHYNKVESDTVMVWSVIVLSAELEDGDSYEWIVRGLSLYGKEVTYPKPYTSASPTLTEPIIDTVTLIVHKTPSPCYPDDDGIDTLTRILTIMPRMEWPFAGEWIGTVYDKDGSVHYNNLTIEIEQDYSLMPSPYNGPGDIYLHNLDNNNCKLGIFTWDGWPFYKHLEYYKNTSVCNSSYGIGKINLAGDSLVFSYQKSHIMQKVTDLTFKGKRL